MRNILQKELLPPPFLPFVCPTNAGKEAKNAADLENREPKNGSPIVCAARNTLKPNHQPIPNSAVAKALVELMRVKTDAEELKQQKHNEGKTKNLPLEFKIKIGSRVEVCTNYDKSDGLYNGACGVVAHVSYTTSTAQPSHTPVPTIIWVKFDDPIIGEKCRAADHSVQEDGSPMDPTWTPVRRIAHDITVKLPHVSVLELHFLGELCSDIKKAGGDVWVHSHDLFIASILKTFRPPLRLHLL